MIVIINFSLPALERWSSERGMRLQHEATPANSRFTLAAARLARTPFCLFLGLLFVGCSGGDATLTLPSDTPAGSGEPAAPDASDLGPAVLVTGLVPGVDSALLYVGALPELPTGEVSYSRFREFSIQDGYVYTNAGHVYVWEGQAREMTRFSVNEAYELVEGPRVSFANRLPGSSNHVFISPTRAYSLSSDLDEVLVWDPEAMVITGSIPMSLPERPATMESFAYYKPGTVVGDKVIWEIVSVDSTNNAAYPATLLAIANTNDEAPVRFTEDTRCVGGGGTEVDAQGNLYVRAGALWGQYAAYGAGSENVRTCMLRVNAGEEAFDPSFMLDFQELTGSYVNYPWFHITGSQYLAHAWNPETPLPETVDDFYAPDATTQFRQLLVDVEARTAEPYPHLAGGRLISSDEFKIDGVSYYQLSQTGYVAGGSTDVVELRPEGIVQRFSVLGSIWAMARIR
jgi:hypothetical protein